jgi:hypothetical protein
VSDADLFKISLDGPGISLSTVDPRMLLELALQYVKALSAVAEDGELLLGLRGLHTMEGSAVLALNVESMVNTQECAREVNELVRDPLAPKYITPLRTQLRELPPGFEFKVANQNWSEVVGVPDTHESRREMVSARVRVIRAGGSRPAIRVEDVAKGRRYTLQTVSEQQAQELAQYLYREIDIRAEVVRRPDNSYSDGRLLKYTPLSEIDPLTAWRAWFATHDEVWRDIPDNELVKALKQKS